MKRLIHNSQWRIRALLLVLVDIVMAQLAAFSAIIIRFELSITAARDTGFLDSIIKHMPFNILVTILIFAGFHLYSSLWEYAGERELINISIAVILSGLISYTIMHLMRFPAPRSFPILYIIFLEIYTLLTRYGYRLARDVMVDFRDRQAQEKDSVMVIGAGEAGAMIIKEMKQSEKTQKKVKCIIDDDPTKIGQYIMGVPVVGNTEDIVEVAHKQKIDQIVIAIPSATKSEIKRIVEQCKQTSCNLRILPGIYQLVNGEVQVSKLRDVKIEDLLGRDQIKVDLSQILSYVKDKVVLVTGGGGSIGSELCRQLARHGVRQLIIVDIYENNAYEIQQELKRKYPDLDLVVLIGSVRNTYRMNTIMEKYRPDVVYHAAAHKHVPLMEDSPNEAIKNNVMGTYKTAKAAAAHGVKRFVLISTDKAVNPTNIMGASKRLCEMVVQMMDRKCPDTEFVAVRFGNVLGSNGSVIPLFRKQIAEGGPVTVTHPDIIRYFMTIPEAVSLVLQAGGYAKGGEIFVLDMGEPVRIVDLAKNMIALSGYKLGEDIEIHYTGLRPGEKLYEELLMDEEGLEQTENEMIYIGHPIEMDDAWFEEKLAELDIASREETDRMKQIVAEIVPTYHLKHTV